jgi:hypothetical protein
MTDVMREQFQRMGARVKVATSDRVRAIEVDVQHDRLGEFFLVRHAPAVSVTVPEVTPWDRHLLLTARVPAGAIVEDGDRRDPVDQTFLCGRDEFHWFVAAVPESARARTVQDAKDALKPAEVWESIRAHNVPAGRRNGRRNEAFLRQGEWFFIPRPEMQVEASKILEYEPIKRGDRSKPHYCRYGYRIGGETVFLCDAYPNGLTSAERRRLPRDERRKHAWFTMVRGAAFYAKGTVSHADHKTIWLPCWHQVVMNRETEAVAMRNVAFLD